MKRKNADRPATKVAATRLRSHEYALLEALADARGSNKAHTIRELIVRAARRELLTTSSEGAA